MAAKRDGTVTEIGDAIGRYLRSHGLVRMSRESLVPIVWSEVVGDWYRRKTMVLRVKRGIVTIKCDSPGCAQQLQLDSALIIERLNERVGRGAVKELRPTSAGIARSHEPWAGPQTYEPDGPTAGDLARMDLEPGERDWVERVAGGLADEDLRRSVEAVLVKHCKTVRWRLAHGYCPCAGCGTLVPPDGRMCTGCDPGRIPRQGSPDVLEHPWRDKGGGW